MKPTHAHAIKSRIARLDARARDSVCPLAIANLVAAMTAELDPQAIPALIGLLEHKHDARGSVGQAILRYGDSAEDSLRGAASTSVVARMLLDELELQSRLLQLGCF